MRVQLNNIFISLFFLLPTVLLAQDSNDLLNKKVLGIDESVFNFGKIPQGKPVNHIFLVKNLSNQKILIDNIQASCGCTTPEWKRDSIAPGGKTEIKVGYNAASIGSFEKTINIQFGKGESETITIIGNVWQTPSLSAPLNKSISYLQLSKINNQ